MYRQIPCHILPKNRPRDCMLPAAAVTAMGISGELAASRMGELDGSASLRTYLIDAVYNLTSEQLERFARVGEYIHSDIAVTQNNEVPQ